MTSMKRSLLLATLAIVLGAAPAAAQSAPSVSRWSAWAGCWTVAEESVEDTADLLARLQGRPSSSNDRATTVCVEPTDASTATVTTRVDSQVLRTERLQLDGAQHPLSEAGCQGWQRSEWSQFAARMYSSAEVACDGQAARRVSGLSTVVAGPVWLDVQVVESEGRTSIRVRRYRPATTSDRAAGTARDVATAALGKRLTLAELTEASAKLPAEAVQAAVLELGSAASELKAKQLRELVAGGVPSRVIDLLVAMAYPKKFEVERASGGFAGDTPWMDGSDLWLYMASWPHLGLWPYYGDPFAATSFYSAYYRNLYYGYSSPFNYRFWGYYDPFYNTYFNTPGIVTVNPGDTSAVATGEGRVVDGRGYTRIRRVEPDPVIRTGNDGGRNTASSSGGSNSGSSGGVSSGGYSGGSSGGGGERTAVPRPPG